MQIRFLALGGGSRPFTDVANGRVWHHFIIKICGFRHIFTSHDVLDGGGAIGRTWSGPRGREGRKLKNRQNNKILYRGAGTGAGGGESASCSMSAGEEAPLGVADTSVGGAES